MQSSCAINPESKGSKDKKLNQTNAKNKRVNAEIP